MLRHPAGKKKEGKLAGYGSGEKGRERERERETESLMFDAISFNHTSGHFNMRQKAIGKCGTWKWSAESGSNNEEKQIVKH